MCALHCTALHCTPLATREFPSPSHPSHRPTTPSLPPPMPSQRDGRPPSLTLIHMNPSPHVCPPACPHPPTHTYLYRCIDPSLSTGPSPRLPVDSSRAMDSPPASCRAAPSLDPTLAIYIVIDSSECTPHRRRVAPPSHILLRRPLRNSFAQSLPLRSNAVKVYFLNHSALQGLMTAARRGGGGH